MRKTLVLLLLVFFTITVCSPQAYSERKKKKPCVDTLTKCPDEGCGGDPKLNTLKNREDKPTSAAIEEWKLAQIISLNEEAPTSWKSGSNRDELEELGEGTAVVVKGWLINAHVTKTPETCNCHLTGEENNDFHLNLVPRKADPMDDSVVIEMSPRKRNPKWNIKTLEALSDTVVYVRVTGWLMFDSAHANFSHMPRSTAWEIHPVTKFEVCQSTKAKCDKGIGWKALEAL